jgi:hypothetical protein
MTRHGLYGLLFVGLAGLSRIVSSSAVQLDQGEFMLALAAFAALGIAAIESL